MSLSSARLRVRTTTSVAIAILALTATESAFADEPQEIVVTAQKRQERLIDVPLAVTAVTAEALSRQQVNDTTSLIRAVPSLSFQQGAGSQSSGFRIRGVGSQLFSLGVEASVSVVVDGVPAARQTQGFADLADIERIEVLRGPQGTLFGRNATAGVINIVTARPTDSLTGNFEATVAEKDEYRAKGSISGPLTDRLRGRISGFYNNAGGYIYNVATRRDVNGFKSWGLRGKLNWDASDSLNLLLSGDFRKSDALCCQSVTVALATPDVITLTRPVVASPTNRRIIDDTDSFNNDKQATVALEANLDLGKSTLTSITAYQSYKNNANNVVDRIDNPVPVYTGGNAWFNQNGGTIDLRQISQELRLSSKGSNDLNYVVGAYYSNVRVDRDFLRRIASCAAGTLGQVCATPAIASVSAFANNEGESIAAFGQADYRLVGGLKLIAGLRFQHETTSVTGTRTSPAIAGDATVPGFGSVSGRRAVSGDALTGKAGLQYEFSRNAQAYASYTRGYKGYGFNTEPATNFATQDPVRPEHVNAYEIGFKGRTADNLLNLSVAAFLSDYTDLQVLASSGNPAVPGFIQTNAGTARTKGVEVEGQLNPLAGISVNFGLTYADSRFSTIGLSCPLQFQATANRPAIAPCLGAAGGSAGLQNVEDGRLPYAPKWRILLTPRVEHELTASRLLGFAQASVSYQSWQTFSLEQDPLLAQKGYALVDASVGVRSKDKGYSLTLFVRNLFDQNYYSSMAHTSLLATPTNASDLTAYVNKDSNRYFGATFGFAF